jgi:hypothetical protein
MYGPHRKGLQQPDGDNPDKRKVRVEGFAKAGVLYKENHRRLDASVKEK